MDSKWQDAGLQAQNGPRHETYRASVDQGVARGLSPSAGPPRSRQRTERSRGIKKLVLCFDGTGNKFHGDDSDSNILKIFRMLDRTADDQYHYYQPGIGTYVVSGSLSHTSVGARINSWYQKAKDSAVGSSFDQHVVGGYRFLMRFYNPGDEIYMFGFSRGAYTARFLAEMLDYIGLLSHGNEEMVKFAWKAFSQWQCRQQPSGNDEERAKGEEKKHKMFSFMKGFRETFSRPVGRIRFLGLFDTVNSVPRFETAWMQRSKFPYTARSSARVIRHAVSIDERRAKFRQDLMYQDNKRHKHHLREKFDQYHHKDGRQKAEKEKTEKDGIPSHQQADGPERGRRASQFLLPNDPSSSQRNSNDDQYVPYRARSTSRKAGGSINRLDPDNMSTLSSMIPDSELDPDGDDEEQDIDEVWFAGGHGDVGGGWEVLVDSKSASHVPLTWMVREAMKAGLPFDPDKVRDMGCQDVLAEERMDNALAGGDIRNNTEIPSIRVANGGAETSPISPPSPEMNKDNQGEGKSKSNFHELMHKAHTARIHDSLTYSSGLGAMQVTAWKVMEWMPFRRMDLLSDGSWKPIRWPLPRGEVRDIPDKVRVHGSVIRRMEMDKSYRPGNLIIGGGGRGVLVADEKYGMGKWECVAEQGDPIGEIWVKINEKKES